MAIRRVAPSFRPRVWGRTQLQPWFPDQAEKTGEVWFETPGELPVLVKFLFTSENLSVQVHPDDAAALEFNSPGKTEMWHILAAEPGAKIAAGFRERVTAEQLRESAISGEIENLLEWHDAAPGDTFFIPAGTVHAIGAGLTLCEIQQASDITYRLYDYNRGRELHLEQGIRVSHLGSHAARVEPRGDVLVECDYFRVGRQRVNAKLRHVTEGTGMAIVVQGSGQLAGESTKAGDVWIFDEPVEIEGPLGIVTVK